VEAAAQARAKAEQGAEQALVELRDAERAVEAARRDAARVEGELASVNQYLRASVRTPGASAALADELEVEPGYELALAAALDGRMRAAIAPDRGQAAQLLDRTGAEGGRVLVAGSDGATQSESPPAPEAEPLASRVRGDS